DFFADRLRSEIAYRLLVWLRPVRDHPTLREDVRTLGGGDIAHRFPDDFLGMAEPIDRRGIHPVDAGGDRVLDGRDRLGVVVAAPAVRPTPATNRPGAEADLGDLEPAPSERTCQEIHDANTSCCRGRSYEYAVTIAEMSSSGLRAATPAKSSRLIAVSGTLEPLPGARRE